MPSKKVIPVTTPAIITFGTVTIVTIIDSISGVHRASCDLCLRLVNLTTTGNPKRLVDHREACLLNSLRKEQRRAPVSSPSSGSASTEAAPTEGALPDASPPSSSRQSRAPASDHRFFPYSQPSSRSSSAHSRQSTESSDTNDSDSCSVDASSLDGSRGCPGVEIEWTPGSIWDTYPYHQHSSRDMKWTIVRVDEDRNVLGIRSTDCEARLAPTNEALACALCLGLPGSDQLAKMKQRAEGTSPYSPYSYLNAKQMFTIMQNQRALVGSLRSKLSNSYRSDKSLKAQLNDFKRIMMHLSKNDIPGLRRLISAALKRHASPRVMMNLLERAVSEFRTAKGFSERDLDLALIVKALGGPRLLFALQKAHGLPSESTLRRRQHIPTLLASIGVPTAAEVDANIEMFCNPDMRPPPPPLPSGKQYGNVAMFDGIATETRCSYCPRTNKVLGLCREHGHRVDTSVTSLEAVEKIRKALFTPESEEEKVCFGVEATCKAANDEGTTRG
ncbi:hypothetical protein DFP72DRAFT_1069028 [Ephemerocybe angulata]|uniref:Uncharacterized protein n=1 Tax=Ephemerocybe angulata TaxID=980116 RepID=A0A8H6HV88_9AGAR|nr:hypothetical protein DFP72DRAFT_1069028 [Tulosesus angulatus]